MNVPRMRKFDERGYANRSVGDKTPFFGRGWNLGSVDSMVAGIRGVGRIDRFSSGRKIPGIFFSFLSTIRISIILSREGKRFIFLNRIRIVNISFYNKNFSIIWKLR